MSDKNIPLTLTKLAKTIRSKNAGIYRLTFEILFDNKKNYDFVKKSNVFSKEFFSKLYGIHQDDVVYFGYFDPGLAIKATIKRPFALGEPGDADIFGCQQYAPLLKIMIPAKISQSRGEDDSDI